MLKAGRAAGPRRRAAPPGRAAGPGWALGRAGRWGGLRLLEDYVGLADGFVDLPGAGPAAREHGRVTGPYLRRLAAIGGNCHPPGEDLHEFMGLERPVRRPRRALPDTDLLVAVLPQGQPAGGHLLAGSLLKRPPVFKLSGGGSGQVRGEQVGLGHHGSPQLVGLQPGGAFTGNGSAIGSVASLLWPVSSNRSSPSDVTSVTVELPVRATSAAALATPGPHIMPAPPAPATVTPFKVPRELKELAEISAGPMIGR